MASPVVDEPVQLSAQDKRLSVELSRAFLWQNLPYGWFHNEQSVWDELISRLTAMENVNADVYWYDHSEQPLSIHDISGGWEVHDDAVFVNTADIVLRHLAHRVDHKVKDRAVTVINILKQKGAQVSQETLDVLEERALEAQDSIERAEEDHAKKMQNLHATKDLLNEMKALSAAQRLTNLGFGRMATDWLFNPAASETRNKRRYEEMWEDAVSISQDPMKRPRQSGGGFLSRDVFT